MVIDASSPVTTTGDGGGLAVLLKSAPEAATAFARLSEVRPAGVHDELLQAPAVRAFAAQFAADVTRIGERERAAFGQATGAHEVAVAQMVWIGDVVPRARAVLDALFGPSTWLDPRRYPIADPSVAVDAFVAAVARLTALDPTLTEQVRLRGARQHGCRRCDSRRSVTALEQGATESDFAAIDDYAASDLPDDAKAALMLVDAMIWTPHDIPDATLEAVRRDLGPARTLEVVLDVVRNAVNKIAVALRTDAAEVTGGVQLFTTDEDGVVVLVSG